MPLRRKRRSQFFPPRYLATAHLSPPSCILKPPLLVLGLRNHLRNLYPLPRRIHRHKRQVRRSYLPKSATPNILHHCFDANLHRSPPRPVHTRSQNQQIANLHRRHKIQVIHRRRYRVRPRMPARRHRANQVDELHQSSAEQVPDRIRVIRKDNLAPFGLRLADRPCGHTFAHPLCHTSAQVSARTALSIF